MNHNIIRDIIELAGMHVDGALIGGIGAIASVILKINGYSWRASLAIIFSGLLMCGYLLPAIQEQFTFLNSTVYFIIFCTGYVSRHLYQFLDQYAPKLLRMAFDVVSRRFNKRN
jgi:hypothetical protein